MKKSKSLRNTSKNALVHGVYASELLLPWESREDLLELHRAFWQEWRPATATEEEAVLDLTRWCWMKRRVQRAAQIAALQEPFAHDIADSGRKTWPGIRKFLRQQAKMDDPRRSTHKMFRLVMDAIATAKEKAEGDLGREERKELNALIESHMQQLQRLVETMQVIATQKNAETVFEAPYKPDELERIVSIEGKVDVRIDKAISRLVNLKEYAKLQAERLSQTSTVSLLPPSPRS